MRALGCFVLVVTMGVFMCPVWTHAAEEGAEGGAGGMNADEAARKSSNPLGGKFFIMLNQIDNYFMQGDITGKTRYINTWAFQPVIPIPSI